MLVLLLVVIVAGAAIALDQRYERGDLRARAEAITGGSVDRGEALFAAYGCGGCHSLSGEPQAQGLVGPPLDTIGSREMIAGKLSNTPDNLARWIRDPQAVTPGTAMPALGLTPPQARDLTAFLYTHS